MSKLENVSMPVAIIALAFAVFFFRSGSPPPPNTSQPNVEVSWALEEGRTYMFGNPSNVFRVDEDSLIQLDEFSEVSYVENWKLIDYALIPIEGTDSAWIGLYEAIVPGEETQ